MQKEAKSVTLTPKIKTVFVRHENTLPQLHEIASKLAIITIGVEICLANISMCCASAGVHTYDRAS